MANYVVCAEDEISSAANKIINYADYLERQMMYYLKVMAWVQEEGIQDELICGELSDLAEEVRDNIVAVATAVSPELSTIISQEVSEIESADRLSYPASLLDEITAVFGQFL